MSPITLVCGDCRDYMPQLVAGSAQACITSPPYWGLRDYDHPDQIGMEDDPFVYTAQIVAVFTEVYRILAPDGVLFLNLGDSYFGDSPRRRRGREGYSKAWDRALSRGRGGTRRSAARIGPLKPKDLIGIPWRIALALQETGWWLRADIIWNKSDARKEPVRDRPSLCHEHLFMLSKRRRYSCDMRRLQETVAESAWRSVWNVAKDAAHPGHPASFPADLVVPCVLAATRPGDLVLDPFAGAFTVAEVCARLDRSFLGIDVRRDFVDMGFASIQQIERDKFLTRGEQDDGTSGRQDSSQEYGLGRVVYTP